MEKFKFQDQKHQNLSKTVALFNSCIRNYYAVNKILNSDWLTTNLTLDDVWLIGNNVRSVSNLKRIYIQNVINVGLVALAMLCNSNPMLGQYIH